MKKPVTILVASLLTVIVGCAGYDPITSMRGTDVAAADPAPPARDYAGKRPGSAGQQKIARTFAEQPPVIPHAVDNFDEINLEGNQCMDCHSVAKYQEKKAPKLGDSHFVKGSTTQMSMTRHNCTQCHVPQVDAPPLVENRFIGNLKQ